MMDLFSVTCQYQLHILQIRVRYFEFVTTSTPSPHFFKTDMYSVVVYVVIVIYNNMLNVKVCDMLYMLYIFIYLYSLDVIKGQSRANNIFTWSLKQ